MRLIRYNSKLKFSSRIALRRAIKLSTVVSTNHLTPELKFHLITPESPLWTCDLTMCDFIDPYWGFYWAGGQALSRYILDHKHLFFNKLVLDIGSGCGACAIAAAHVGAKAVIANDIDSVACEVIAMNSALNNSKLHISKNDFIFRNFPLKPEIILIGDMFYDSEFGTQLHKLLKECKKNGAEKIFIGDPGRHAFVPDSLALRHEYSLLPHTVSENNGFKNSYVWEMC